MSSAKSKLLKSSDLEGIAEIASKDCKFVPALPSNYKSKLDWILEIKSKLNWILEIKSKLNLIFEIKIKLY